jgi:DNA-binding NtrC family response regulator
MNQYSFPGNVRELQYTMERAIIMGEGEKIDAADILFSSPESGALLSTEPADQRLSSVEKSTILKVIQKHNGKHQQRRTGARTYPHPAGWTDLPAISITVSHIRNLPPL